MPKPTMAELPEILTAQHMADYMDLSRKTIYELFKIKPEYGGIPCISIGTSKRALKEDFCQWIQDRKNQHQAS